MIFRILILAVLLFAGRALQAAEIRVAADSSLDGPLQRIAAAFRRDTGHELVLTFAAGGRLKDSIVKGAPYEVLLTADPTLPRKLEAQGLARAGSSFTYASGKLVLWSAREGAVDGRGEVLRRPPAGQLAIADPATSAYGAAALAALRNLGVLSTWQPQLLAGDGALKAYQLAGSGRATLGLVAMSQVAEGGRIARGSGWLVPANLYPPLEQGAVLLNPGAANPAATSFLTYLRSNAARSILRAAGYVV